MPALGTHDTKTRGEVRGGGRKPWRQKGTGRARQGSTRAPNWVGGGVVWGPHPRKYTQRMPKKMRQLAVRSALSAKVRDERLIVIAGLEEIEPKTKAMKTLLQTLPAGAVDSASSRRAASKSFERAAGNLQNVQRCIASYPECAGPAEVRAPGCHARMRLTVDRGDCGHLPAGQREPSSWKLARMAAKAEAEKEA